MAVVRTSLAIPLLSLHLLLLAATNEAATFSIINQCSYTVWPAAVPVGGGMQLDPGKVWTLDMPAGSTSGRIWARTGCIFDGKGDGSCLTGDCGGLLACTNYSQPPNTLAEFTISQGQMKQDFFDISLLDGFNVPMDFLPVPVQGRSGCGEGPRCPANITSQCPSELKAPGGCNNACTVFNQDKYCCTGNAAGNCSSTDYSVFFKQMCPDAYSYPMDDNSTIFSCSTGTNYQIIFCPLINQTISPAAASPLPAPSVDIAPASLSPLPAPIGPTSKKSSTASRVPMILAPVGGFILLTMLFIFILLKRRTRQHQEMNEEEEFGELQGMPMRFTFQQLKVATEKFTEKLGAGGFGSVFKGQFAGESIAVKRLDRAGQGKREFSAEVETIGSTHHINLVRLIGFCAEKSHRLLVYEYMPKGSLDKWIYFRHDNNAPPLDWSTRCKIIKHIAKALAYLHEECTKKIAHLDVKPQNILLDDNFNAKLSDFGLCKLIDRDMSQVVTRMRGTPGYLAPEWLTSHITEKADVYSFGVVVMEVISGRKNLDTSRSEGSIHLITLLEEKVKSDRLVELIDNNSYDMQEHKKDAIQMMVLAMWCLQIDCRKRPKMSEVVMILEGAMDPDTNIDYNFVTTGPENFGIAGNVNSSALPLNSDVSGPR